NDQPKPFYDFYVCNNITWRERADREGASLTRTLIIDANIKKLADISHFIFITGAGGLGKSMMMRHLLINTIDNYETFKLIPVFVPLKDFDDTSGKLFEYIYSKIADFGGEITKEGFDSALLAGRCLLLFDGLDEIGTNNVGFFERELGSFTDKYSENYYVISSRPSQFFVSFERFCVLRLLPFRIEQALHLIDNLDFRPDDPSIKAKFRDELSKRLYRTHRAFTENPLLLTIMLMTFEMFAEVPSQMHIFYREAFNALSRTHDANKGAYKRELKSKLSVDAFSDVFAEICFRTYRDEKFEFSMTEFEFYYQKLNTPYAKSVLPEDFMHDLCYSLCLMYLESGKYYFTHRSFQEYFSAVFLSKQKDSVISKLGDFFEKRERRM
ncbi:MAG: NACHT domain-containing protein, partial [Candidatus Subteraquimicrobiales bacterium]|nr:NACHT domain-containing protein [Candidatus Subteraquimicrobiales bacterium]